MQPTNNTNNTPIPEEKKYANPFDEQETLNNTTLPFVKDGDIIDIRDVIKKEERLFKFAQPDGTERNVNRRVLTFKDGTQLVISISLSWEITALRKEYGERLGKIKIKREGTGLQTKWRALPVL